MRGGSLIFLLANSLDYVIREDLTLWNEGKLGILSIEMELQKNKSSSFLWFTGRTAQTQMNFLENSMDFFKEC